MANLRRPTFVNKERVKAFECSICLNTLRSAVSVCDDHVFCKQCISEYIKEKQRNMGSLHVLQCPLCRAKFVPQNVTRIKFIDRQIGCLSVKCPNYRAKNRRTQSQSRSRSRSRERNNHNSNDNNDDERRFCHWIGKWEKLKTHIAECRYQKIKCTFCHKLIQRRTENEHFKECPMYPIECECEQKVPRNGMRMHKITRCAMTMVRCAYCNQHHKRGDMEHHFNACTEAPVSCKYYQCGCTVGNIKRKDLAKHMAESVEKHLDLMTDSQQRLEKVVGDLRHEAWHYRNVMTAHSVRCGELFLKLVKHLFSRDTDLEFEQL